MILEDLAEQAAAGAGRPENIYRKYNVAAKNYDGINALMAQNIRRAGVNAARALNARFDPNAKNNSSTTKNNMNGGRRSTTRKNKRR